MGPLSVHLRKRVVSAVGEEGISCRAAARRFGVSFASAIRWVAALRERGSYAPLPMGGDTRSQRVEAHADYLLRLHRREPDLTLAEICARLERAARCRPAYAPNDADFGQRGQARADEGAKGSPHAPPPLRTRVAAHRQRRVAAALAQCRYPPDRAGGGRPKRRAAARQLMPSSPTAETTRLRKCTNKGPISPPPIRQRSRIRIFLEFGNPKRFNSRGNRSSVVADPPLIYYWLRTSRTIPMAGRLFGSRRNGYDCGGGREEAWQVSRERLPRNFWLGVAKRRSRAPGRAGPDDDRMHRQERCALPHVRAHDARIHGWPRHLARTDAGPHGPARGLHPPHRRLSLARHRLRPRRPERRHQD